MNIQNGASGSFTDDVTTIELGTRHFQDTNSQIRELLDNVDYLRLTNVNAQRYIGCTLGLGKKIDIHGVPGNDMACYMDGGFIEVFGNAQDQIANTMNDGTIVVHGRCGDAAGYAMRGGKMFIRDDCGWRVGINMKQYKDKCPTIVIGGNAGNFLGEYMAGGVILLLGEAGEYLASGMHGGVVYLKNPPSAQSVMPGLTVSELDDRDKSLLEGLLAEYNEHFGCEIESPVTSDLSGFCKLMPETSRPYESLYAK